MSIKKRTKLIIGAIAIVAFFCFNVGLVKDSGNMANISLSNLITSTSASGCGYSGMTCYSAIGTMNATPFIACGSSSCYSTNSLPGSQGICP